MRKCIYIIATLLMICLIFAGCNNSGADVSKNQSDTDIQTDTEKDIDTQVTEDEATSSAESDSAKEETSSDNGGNVSEDTSKEQETEQTTVNKDMYKNPVKLFARSVMLSANEFVGEYNSVEFKNHGLMLTDGATSGSFISEDIDMGGSFKKMVASWNASSEGGTVEISVSVKLDDGSYTNWYSWGEWSAIAGASKSKSPSDENGKVDVDVLTLTNECQGIVRYKIEITKASDTSPILYNVTLACDKEISNLKAPDEPSVKLDVPYRRQQDVPEIGGSICSATSLSMVMLYHGEQIEGVEGIAKVAWGVRDYGEEIFGNWAFNVAYAGELGYNAYVDFYDIDSIKYAVSTNHPIVCSIKVKKGQLADSGFRGYTTNGHLICIVGYEERDGKGWLLVNDPAHPEVTAILESDFENIYRGVSYVVQIKPVVDN